MNFITEQYRAFQEWPRFRRENLFNSIVILLAFLLVSCFLIFVIANLGIQRDQAKWLPVNLSPQLLPDYQVYESEEPQRPRLALDILDAVEEDTSRITSTPTPATTVATPETPTPTPSPTPVLSQLSVEIGGPYRGNEGSPIFLAVANPIPNGVTYLWDLDDDGRYDDKEGASVLALFEDEGRYPVGVEAADEFGQVVTDSTIINVFNVPPIVSLGPDRTVDEAETFTLSATVTDPGNDILFLQWDFGDNTPNNFETLTPSYAYADNGEYLVRLRVEDNDGGVTEDTLLVRVENLPPIVDAGPDQVVTEGQKLTVNGSATDPAGDRDPLTYAWDFDYKSDNFTLDAVSPTASFTYLDGPSKFVVALRVQDDDGGEAIDTLNVSVNNAPPSSLSITHSGRQVEASEITAQVSATDVGSDTLRYSFDWESDGNFESTNQLATTSRHKYPDNGDYTLTVVVDDGDGGQLASTRVITIANLPPKAVAQSTSSAVEGSIIIFSGSGSTDPAGPFDPLTYQWNFGDGQSASGVQVNHTYPDNGYYTATLTVRDDDGGVNSTTLPVTILNANPLAFAGDDFSINEGQTHTFSGSATDPGPNDTIFSFAWDFNYDGAFFNQEVLGPGQSRTFLDGPATIVVALRARDDDYPASPGEIGEHIDTVQVTVNNVPPSNVAAQGPYFGAEMTPVTLAAAVAVDVVSDTLTYAWELNGDNLYDDRSERVVTYTWASAGDYTIGLKVSDEDGGSGFDTANVTIANAPPVAVLSPTFTVAEDALPLSLDGSASYDPTMEAITHTWDLNNDNIFGDATGPIASFNAADDGIYTVTLQVIDSRGAWDTASSRITVVDVPPTPVILVSGVQAEGISIGFDGSTSTDPVDSIVRWDWIFGDGKTATGPNVSNIYDDDGSYTVRLTVFDDDGITASTTRNINIANLPPSAVLTSSTTAIFEGQTILFGSGNSNDPGILDSLSYTWNFGDSTIVNTTTTTITHTYLDNPPLPQTVFTVTLTVRDDGSPPLADTDTITVTVLNQDPTGVSAGGPYTTTLTQTITLNGTGSDVAADLPLNFAWDYYDDGSVDAAGPNPVFSPTLTGTYPIRLQVDDGDGGVVIVTTTVTVNSIPPLAGLSMAAYFLWRAYRRRRYG